MRAAAIVGYADRVGNYIAALEAVGVEPVVTLDVERAADCAGLLLPGGGDMDPALFGQEDQGSQDIDRALDDIQLEVLDRFVRAGKPVLGICRGHQVLNVYFGGGLIQDLPTAASHIARPGADSVHRVRILPGTVLNGLYGPETAVNSAHHQGTAPMGRDLRAAAFAPDGVVEALEHVRLPVLGVQFHPERMAFAHARPDTADGAPIFGWFRERL